MLAGSHRQDRIGKTRQGKARQGKASGDKVFIPDIEPCGASRHDTISLGILVFRDVSVEAIPHKGGFLLGTISEFVRELVHEISTVLERRRPNLPEPLLDYLRLNKLDEWLCALADLTSFEVHIVTFDTVMFQEVHAHMSVYGLAKWTDDITGDLVKIRPSLVGSVSIHVCFSFLGIF
jgi:hypothetical protein